MSRRKQDKPKHLANHQLLANGNGIGMPTVQQSSLTMKLPSSDIEKSLADSSRESGKLIRGDELFSPKCTPW